MDAIRRSIFLISFFALVLAVFGGHYGDAEIEAQGLRPFQGKFQFSGQVEPVIKIQFELAKKNSRVEELKQDGYVCSHVLQNSWKCRKVSALTSVSQKIYDRAVKQVRSEWFEFEDQGGQVDVDFDGAHFKSWIVNQPVSFADGKVESYQMTWTKSVSKIILQDDLGNLEPVYLNIDSGEQLNHQVSVNNTIDKNRFERFVVQLIYKL